MSTQKTPTVGRIVMYAAEAGTPEANNHSSSPAIVPAIVVRTWGEDYGSAINLKIFTDGPTDTWRTSVRYDENKAPNTWHWPEIK